MKMGISRLHFLDKDQTGRQLPNVYSNAYKLQLPKFFYLKINYYIDNMVSVSHF